jgi:hypothetical protein
MQFIIDRYRKLGPEAFWSTYSVDGVPMTLTAITEALRQERALANSKDAAEARGAFGESFTARFSNQNGALTKPSAIAKRYQQLKEVDCSHSHLV